MIWQIAVMISKIPEGINFFVLDNRTAKTASSAPVTTIAAINDVCASWANSMKQPIITTPDMTPAIKEALLFPLTKPMMPPKSISTA